jgi:HPt (histidine-containing phosphotransfer) domain-containing protein
MLAEGERGDTGGEGASRGPIDRTHLRRYTSGDEGLEREVLDLFLAQVPLTIGSLKDAACDKDWHVAAHTLKGSAGAVGAWRVASLAREAELLGGSADLQACIDIISRLEEAAREVETYVAEALPLRTIGQDRV